MSEMRAMRRDEIQEVAALYKVVDASDWRIPPHELAPWLARTLFENPWFDAEIPSLVYVDDAGEILGFIGSHVRPMRFDGQPVRMAAGGPLIAHPRVRNLAVGARLLRRYFAGAQDLTITDGASDEIRQIFELVGGQMMHPSSMVWVRVFRPLSYAGNRAMQINLHVREHIKPRARRLLPLLDIPAERGFRYFKAPTNLSTINEELTPRLLLESLPLLSKSLRLVPDYDVEGLEWLFAELHHNRTWGTPHRRLVRDGGGRMLGWYIYYSRPDEAAQVLQVAARERHMGAVVDDLFAHAVAQGSAAVQGRVEANLLAEVAHRGALFRFSARSLIHARDSDLLGAVTSGHALLTRLEGEWWMAS